MFEVLIRESLSHNWPFAQYVTESAGLMISQNYTLQKIYNFDTTGLNFKMLQNKSFATTQECWVLCFKMSKVLVKMLMCSNVTRTCKLSLTIISKNQTN